jgi:hypothetical protein
LLQEMPALARTESVKSSCLLWIALVSRQVSICDDIAARPRYGAHFAGARSALEYPF